jgi:hypothetical protein
VVVLAVAVADEAQSDHGHEDDHEDGHRHSPSGQLSQNFPVPTRRAWLRAYAPHLAPVPSPRVRGAGGVGLSLGKCAGTFAKLRNPLGFSPILFWYRTGW